MTDMQTLLAGMVRPLEWMALPGSLSGIDECAVADTPFSHRYKVQRDPWADGYMVCLHPRLPVTDSTLWWESKGHPTLEAAQSAAQADYTARILAALNPDAVLALVAAAYADAAGTIDKRKTDYIENHGAYDPSTGVTEFPGNGDEWVGEWEENADAIRALTPTDATADLERMLADARAEGLEMAAERCQAKIDAWVDEPEDDFHPEDPDCPDRIGPMVNLIHSFPTAIRAMKGEGA